jgi:hypothetical protein
MSARLNGSRGQSTKLTSEHLVEGYLANERELFFSDLGIDNRTLTLIDTSDDSTCTIEATDSAKGP